MKPTGFLAIMVLLASGMAVAAAAGAGARDGVGRTVPDPGYGVAGIAVGPALMGLGVGHSTVDRVGRSLVAGSFQVQFEERQIVIARFRRDGSLDRTFGTAGQAEIGEPGALLVPDAISIDTEGRVLVAATSSQVHGGRVYRLLPTGRLDAGFGGVGGVTVPISVADLDARTGRVVLAGALTGPVPPGASAPAVVRLTGSGAPDPAFGRGGVSQIDVPGADPLQTRSFAKQVVVDRAGRILVSGQAAGSRAGVVGLVARLRPDGSPDRSFAGSGVLLAGGLPRGRSGPVGEGLALRRDGRILAAGSVRGGPRGSSAAVLGLRPDGRRDPTFGVGGLALVPRRQGVTRVVEARDGSVVVAGLTRITRISSDGDDSRAVATRASRRTILFVAGITNGPAGTLDVGGMQSVPSRGPGAGTTRLVTRRYVLRGP